MAHYEVIFSCGHSGVVSLIGKAKDREWRLERYKNFGICEDCKRKARDEENAKMLAEAKEMELPQLNGTEKQIAWAITIRQNFVHNIENLDFESDEVKEKYLDAFQNLVETKKSAHWWIDNRDKTLKYLISNEIEKIKELTELKEIDNNTIAEQSKNEMTISGERVIHDGRVEIIVNDNLIKAIYEKNTNFINIVRNLRFQWNGNYWSRRINKFTGLAEDRAGELIANLINNGFKVYCSNDSSREKAKNGTYKEENNYWIINVDGNLGIKMYAKNDNIYNYSRKLTNSKWDSIEHCVVVNVSHYKEVLDFAETFGFSITEKAKKIIQVEIEKENKNLEIAINKKIVQNNSYKLLDNLLTENYNIIEDLKDD